MERILKYCENPAKPDFFHENLPSEDCEQSMSLKSRIRKSKIRYSIWKNCETKILHRMALVGARVDRL